MLYNILKSLHIKFKRTILRLQNSQAVLFSLEQGLTSIRNDCWTEQLLVIATLKNQMHKGW